MDQQVFCYEGLLRLFAAVAVRAERDAERGSTEARIFLQELRQRQPSARLVRKGRPIATVRWDFNNKQMF